MKTLQHDKYLSQSPSEQKLLSFSKSKKNKKEDALQIGNDLQRTSDYAFSALQLIDLSDEFEPITTLC